MKALVLLLSALISFQSFAADDAVGEVSGSIEGSGIEVIPYLGGTSFTLTGGEAEDMSYRSGMQVGVLGGYTIQPGLVLEAGLAYLETGAEVDFIFAKQEWVFQQIAVPVYARWSFTSWDRNSMFVRGGLVTSYITSAKAKGSFLGETTSSEDIMDDTKRLQVLASLGLGNEYTLTPNTSLVGDLNYLRGLTKATKSGGEVSQGFAINLGVALKL